MKPHVGAVGVSKGGDLVLSLATYIPEVKAGVWINGCNANVQSALNLRDSVLPGLEFDFGKIEVCFHRVLLVLCVYRLNLGLYAYGIT